MAMSGLRKFLRTTYSITNKIGGPHLPCGQQNVEICSEDNTVQNRDNETQKHSVRKWSNSPQEKVKKISTAEPEIEPRNSLSISNDFTAEPSIGHIHYVIN